VGRATAIAFARRGAWLALIARGTEGLEAARREAEAAGVPQALALPADTAEPDAFFAVADRAARRHRHLGELRHGDGLRPGRGHDAGEIPLGDRGDISPTCTARWLRCDTCGCAMPAPSSRSAPPWLCQRSGRA
jgi:NAD(P)-dependent dehydrogenase (short-subunit alcohol dehydrogenase family)